MTTNNDLKITTVEGPIEGIEEHNVRVFKGIPYAKAPLGDLRWRRPEPVDHWKDALAADKYGAACFQNLAECIASGGGDPTPPDLSEDCLYLNVWAPKLDANSAQELRPVMVWIHGGAYIIGAGGLPPYIGAPLVDKGAVVVSFNYRLGHLGFFAHPDLEKELRGGPANFGLLDQIAALQWVQRNIEKFGGDPKNVTIFGQSAGGKSVLALFTSPLAQGLFHKGIAQSIYGLPEVTRAKAIERGAAFATAALASGPKDGSTTDTLTRLRALSAKDFWTISTGASNAPCAIVGDEVLSKPIFEAFKAGEQAKLPLIIGNTSDDASVLDAFAEVITKAQIVAELRKGGFPFAVYYPGVVGDDELGRQVCRDLVFTVTTRRFAEKHRKVSSVYRYYFDYMAQELRAEYPNGPRHGDDVSYVFGTGDLCPPTKGHFTDADRTFEGKVTDYWFEFAKSGKPSAKDGAEWLPHAWEKFLGLPVFKDRTLILGDKIELKPDFTRARLEALALVLGIIGEQVEAPEEEAPPELADPT